MMMDVSQKIYGLRFLSNLIDKLEEQLGHNSDPPAVRGVVLASLVERRNAGTEALVLMQAWQRGRR